MSLRVNELDAKQVIDDVEFSVGMWIKVIAGAFKGLEGYIKEIFVDDDGYAEFTCFLEFPCDVIRSIVEARFSRAVGRHIVLEELGLENVVLKANEAYPANGAMTYCITGLGSLDLNELAATLHRIGLRSYSYSEALSVEAFLHSLPDTHIPGLADAADDWIRSWGGGGGDLSTETRLRETISECADDITAKALAETMYDSIADDYKTAFEAVVLVRDAISEAMKELESGGDLCEVG